MPDDRLLGVFEPGGIRVLYQPVVELETRQVLGYEALARGPAGTALEDPTALFDLARRDGLVDELDWCCRGAALEGALRAEMGNSLTLFMNTEPDVGSEPVPERYEEVIGQAEHALRVVVEVTESAVVERPAALLQAIDWARDRSWGVALDDIGANPGSLAMMPFLEPDVIKLDMRLVQQHPTQEIGMIVSAALAQAERSGAVIAAEGIETEDHLQAALAMGATVGQGWLFGHPAPLPASLPVPDDVIQILSGPAPRSELTPFSAVRAARPVRRGSKRTLVEMATHLEEQAIAWRDGPVILSTFQDGDHWDTQRYETLAEQGSFVVLLGHGMPDDPCAGVRGAALPDGHRLHDEWSVVVVGPHYAGALVARDLNDTGPEADRRYDFAVTHDRNLVVEAGRALLRQLAP